MKLIALVGSLRKDSYNTKLTRFMQDRYKEQLEIEIADIRALPHFDQDQEGNPPAVVVALKDKIAEADGVLIVTPEFNWSIPGVLKNSLDWISRVPRVMINKPVLTTGVTPNDWGTIRAQLHLREILSGSGLSAKMLPMGSNQVLISYAKEKFDEHGRLTDQKTLEFLDVVVARFIDLMGEDKS